MVPVGEVSPDPETVNALRSELTWTHLRERIVIEDPLKRGFYVEFCRQERQCGRTLAAKISGVPLRAHRHLQGGHLRLAQVRGPVSPI